MIKSTMRLKNRLVGMNKLRGYPVETRASVLLYLVLQQDRLTNLTRHSKITGLPKKKLSKLSRKFARLMEMPQIFSSTNSQKMVGDILDLMQSDGIPIDFQFRNDCVMLSDYISNELDKRNLPYKNSTNSTVIWMVSIMREEGNTTESNLFGKHRDTTDDSWLLANNIVSHVQLRQAMSEGIGSTRIRIWHTK